MTKDELDKEIARARKNVRYMEKSGQKNTVHHQNLAKLEAQLVIEKPAKKGRVEEQ